MRGLLFIIAHCDKYLGSGFNKTIAYSGAAPPHGAVVKLVEQAVVDGHLPAERAEGCEGEYAQVKRAMPILIDPFIDRSLAKRIKSKQWFNLGDSLEVK
jgi:hypothetical protein